MSHQFVTKLRCTRHLCFCLALSDFSFLLMLQAFTGHKGPVSCLTFRQGTSELFSGSFDRTIKVWNADDRAYITTLFGHQSEVLTIDCLRKERILTVGRDRTMHLWKVYIIWLSLFLYLSCKF